LIFFFQAEDGIRDFHVTGVQTCALPICTRADLRVGTEEEAVEGAWAAGDVSAVPDLTGGGVGGYCVPNAQHAVRQAKLLAKNLRSEERRVGKECRARVSGCD